MASCAYPTPTARSNLWSYNVKQTVNTPFKGRQSQPERYNTKTISHREEEINKEVLDFAKLENDIMKNVLSEEENRLELHVEESNNTFPSFNYVPPPIPHSFLKSNPILKLYPRDFMSSININKQCDVFDRQRTSIQTVKKCFRTSSDRHRLQYPDPLPQIPEMQHTLGGAPGQSLKPLIDGKMVLATSKPKYRLSSTTALTYSCCTAPETHQYIYTPSNSITYDTSRFCTNLPQHFYNAQIATETVKPLLGSNKVFNPEPLSVITQSAKASVIPDAQKKTDKAKVENFSMRTMPTKKTPRNVENKPMPVKGETVKTFAQIVAASKPNPINIKSDYRCHE